MELLPESSSQFRDPKYWNRFFQQRGAKTFEWYGEFCDIEVLLKKYLTETVPKGNKKGDSSVLILGNGNSTLPIDISKKLKFHRITNTDFSHVALAEMSAKFPKSDFPQMQWTWCDVRDKGLQKAFPDLSFDVVIDKAFLDSFLACDDQGSVVPTQVPVPTNGSRAAGSGIPTPAPPTPAAKSIAAETSELLDSVMAILRPGGTYILISLLQPYIVKELTRYLLYASTSANCPASVEIIPFRTTGTETLLEPFFVVIKKKELEAPSPKLLCKMIPQRGDVQINTEEFALFMMPKKIKEIVANRQVIAVAKTWKPGQHHEIHLFATTSQTLPKYTISLYDNSRPSSKCTPTVAVLVPLGQEADWLYQTTEGNQKLAEECKTKRLLIITIGYGFQSSSSSPLSSSSSAKLFEGISAEVSPYLTHLALLQGKRIPVMAISDNMGQRIEVYSTKSDFAENIFVYDFPIASTDKRRRTMAFACNPRLVQSEVMVHVDPKSQSTTFDLSAICSEYYKSVLASLGLLSCKHVQEFNSAPLSCLLLGIGGGVLVNLFKALGKVNLIAVELDPQVVTVARDFFSYPADVESDSFSLRTVVQDALTFVDAVPVESQDVIVVDINCMNRESAILCPPQPFLDDQFLSNAKRCLKPGGILIFNLVTRSESARKEVYSSIKAKFASCFELESDDDLNRVVVCGDGCASATNLEERRKLFVKDLEALTVRRATSESQWTSEVDNMEWGNRLQVL